MSKLIKSTWNTIKQLNLIDSANPNHSRRSAFLAILALKWQEFHKADDFYEQSLKQLINSCNINFVLPNILKKVPQELVSIVRQFELFDLVLLYEALCCEETRDKEGQFYTPIHIVERMWNGVLEGSSIENLKILDPACGAGAFLIFIAEKKLKVLNHNYTSNINWIENHIFGTDKDLFAAFICQELLSLTAYKYSQDRPETCDLRPHSIVNKDFLMLDSSERAFKVNKFNVIIGNPPYGLARGEKLTEKENQILKLKFKQYKFGKINKYLAFMAHSTSLLDTNAILSFVVPNAWLGIRSAKTLRELWCQAGVLKSLDILPKNTFQNANVEPVIFCYKNNTTGKQITIRNITANKEFSFPYSVWSKNKDFCLPSYWSDFATEFFSQCDSHCYPLASEASPFTPFIALQAYATGKGQPAQNKADVKNHAFHFDKKIDRSCIPYAEGRDIGRFSFKWSGRYLRYGPWLAEHQPIERYTNPRIVIREILRPHPYILSASYLEQPFAYNRSVLHILAKEKAEKDMLLALLGIINSKLASFIISFRGKKSQRTIFPKIVNDDLKQFPIPHNFKENFQELSKLSSLILNNNNLSLQKQLDSEVYKLYNLSRSSIQKLEEQLQLT